MELREFVKTTLVEIAEGVSDAKIEYLKLKGQIQDKRSCEVRFNIALTQTEKADSSKGIGVVLSSVKIGANKDEGQTSSSLTSVEFVVPVQLP